MDSNPTSASDEEAAIGHRTKAKQLRTSVSHKAMSACSDKPTAKLCFAPELILLTYIERHIYRKRYSA